MTPYESEHIDNHNNNKTNTVINTPNILSDLEHFQPSLSSQERTLRLNPSISNITDLQGYFPPIDLNNTIHDI